MLYYLSDMTDWHSALNIFRYVTFRAFMGAGTAFVLSLILGPWMISSLRAYKIGQMIRQGKEMEAIGHDSKAGTPTMGGLLIIFTTLFAALLWCQNSNTHVWLACATMLFMGGIGFADDWLKLKRNHSGGLKEWQKLILQGLWVIIAYLVIELLPGTKPYARQLMVPFFKEPVLMDMTAPGTLVFMFLVLVGTTNAVNLTDGLDGLAVGCVNSAVAAYLVLAYVAGHVVFATYLQVPAVNGAQELAVFCGCLFGAGMGFLWWNAYPAKVFMGDTGSLALGGVLAMVAILIKQELAMLIIGFVFFAEAASVIIQRYWFKYTRIRYGEGRRVFLMAPIHHHFERQAKDRARAHGISPNTAENMVVTRFWLVSIVCALLGLATLKLR